MASALSMDRQPAPRSGPPEELGLHSPHRDSHAPSEPPRPMYRKGMASRGSQPDSDSWGVIMALVGGESSIQELQLPVGSQRSAATSRRRRRDQSTIRRAE